MTPKPQPPKPIVADFLSQPTRQWDLPDGAWLIKSRKRGLRAVATYPMRETVHFGTLRT